MITIFYSLDTMNKQSDIDIEKKQDLAMVNSSQSPPAPPAAPPSLAAAPARPPAPPP